MTNEELSEYYGFKAHEYGFFELWREKTHDYMKQNPKSDRSEVYGRFFIQLFDEKNQPPLKKYKATSIHCSNPLTCCEFNQKTKCYDK